MNPKRRNRLFAVLFLVAGAGVSVTLVLLALNVLTSSTAIDSSAASSGSLLPGVYATSPRLKSPLPSLSK